MIAHSHTLTHSLTHSHSHDVNMYAEQKKQRHWGKKSPSRLSRSSPEMSLISLSQPFPKIDLRTAERKIRYSRVKYSPSIYNHNIHRSSTNQEKCAHWTVCCANWKMNFTPQFRSTMFESETSVSKHRNQHTPSPKHNSWKNFRKSRPKM